MNIKKFHFNCGTLRPYGFFPLSTIPLSGRGRYFRKGLGVIHCLLLDTGAGLVLVDTGYGTDDITHPTRAVKIFNKVIGFANDLEETALHQVRALGYDPSDVRHIFLTHMHLDHTGGLPDFPHAKVHVYQKEHDIAMHGSGFISNFYIARHWAHEPDWEIHTTGGIQWHGLDCTPQVEVGEARIFLVPMLGHSPGNCMVVILLPDDSVIVHGGDTFYTNGQFAPGGPIRPPFFWMVQLFNLFIPVTRAIYGHEDTLRRVNINLGDRLTIFSTHDPNQFELLSGISLD